MIATNIEREKLAVMKERNEILKQRNVLMEKMFTKGSLSGQENSNRVSSPTPTYYSEGIEYLLDSDEDD